MVYQVPGILLFISHVVYRKKEERYGRQQPYACMKHIHVYTLYRERVSSSPQAGTIVKSSIFSCVRFQVFELEVRKKRKRSSGDAAAAVA